MASGRTEGERGPSRDRPCHARPQVRLHQHPGGEHDLTDASDARLGLSEGWANLVAIWLENGRDAGTVTKRGFAQNYESARTTRRSPTTSAMSSAWRASSGTSRLPRGEHANRSDSVSIEFADLFRVYSPTLETLQNGPLLASIDDFTSRLVNNGAVTQASVDAIRSLNLTRP